MKKQMALNGKTAVITGAARGPGWAYCQRLAADGANVVAVDIDDPAGPLGRRWLHHRSDSARRRRRDPHWCVSPLTDLKYL
jgi:NAD(P)-dependent dehydrogenase (short-subunit alcohol dehydrogenase family)